MGCTPSMLKGLLILECRTQVVSGRPKRLDLFAEINLGTQFLPWTSASLLVWEGSCARAQGFCCTGYGGCDCLFTELQTFQQTMSQVLQAGQHVVA